MMRKRLRILEHVLSLRDCRCVPTNINLTETKDITRTITPTISFLEHFTETLTRHNCKELLALIKETLLNKRPGSILR